MKPAWDKLMTEYEGSKTLLVADADCDGAGKDLCERVNVASFPTIKYGDPGGDPDDFRYLREYKGERDLRSLKKFASGLASTCSMADTDLCSEEQKKQIKEYRRLEPEEREEIIEEKQAQVDKLENDFKEFIHSLDKQYDAAVKRKDEGVAAIKQGGLGLIKSVHSYMKKAYRKKAHAEL